MCLADRVLLANGKVYVGRIISDESGTLRLITGGLSGPSERRFTRDKITRIERGAREKEQIKACRDVGRLRLWTMAYLHAGLDDLAAQCLEQALELSPSLAQEPLREGSASLRRFWNRTLLRRRAGGVGKGDVAGLLELANWARTAGLVDEAADHLRQAWDADRRSEEVATLAGQWHVPLEPWVQLDLTPALDTSLFRNNVYDETRWASAKPGQVFVMLPLRYDRRAGPQTLSKASFRGKDMRGFYGLRVVRLRKERVDLEFAESEIIYERMELKPKDEGRPKVSLRNILGPRRQEGQKFIRDRVRGPPQTLLARDWVAAVIEIPESAQYLQFQMDEGAAERLDLEFLRSARDPVPASARRNPTSRAMAAILEKVRGPSPAMAALAIARLARIRDEMGATVPQAWTTAVDPAILAAGATRESNVQAAAWAYFATYRSVPKVTLDFMANQPAEVHLAWVRLIECGMGIETCAYTWPAVGFVGARTAAGVLPSASTLLGAILRSDDPAVCAAALDALIRLKGPVDWGFLAHASQTARSDILSRLDTVTDEDLAVRVLIALIPGVHPQMAQSLAERARQLVLPLTGPDDPILKQWASLHDPGQQTGLLTVLQEIPLGDIVYSRRFARMMRDATAASSARPVREAAFRLLVQQARFSREALPAGPVQPVDSGHRSAVRRHFPVLVLEDHARRDPLFQGLRDAVQSTSRPARLAALAALALGGYAEAAADALVAVAEDDSERNALLKDLLAIEELAESDGLLAMLGHLLEPPFASSANLILSHLSHVAAGTPPVDRWRILAAVKSGIHFGRLNELSASLKPPTSGAAVRWLYQLGHMTAQDRQRLAVSRDLNEREDRLRRIDARRGFLVDGRYGAVAIVETALAEESLSGRSQWQAPRRITVAMPDVVIESNEADDSYRVLWGKQVLGRGRLLENPPYLRSPASYYPALRTIPGTPFTGEAAAWERSEESAEPVGPLVLPSLPVLTEPTPGKMTLDIGRYLREALEAERVYGDRDVAAIVPEPYKITLRYAAFGSYCGVGTARRLPDKPPPGGVHLLNTLLIFERID